MSATRWAGVSQKCFRTHRFHAGSVPEAPENAEAGDTGVVRRQDVHVAVADVDARIGADGCHGLVNHVRGGLTGTVRAFPTGVNAGENVGAEGFDRRVRLVGNNGEG